MAEKLKIKSFDKLESLFNNLPLNLQQKDKKNSS